VLDALGLKTGAVLDITIDGGKVVMEPKLGRKKYRLADLIAQCDPSAPETEGGREWIDAPPVGRELL
jgi:antitoxin ChpS